MSRISFGTVVLLAGLGVLSMIAEQGPAQADKGEKIVFASLKFGEKTSSLYVVYADGSGRTRITKGEALEMDPTLSPDGKRVAFSVLDMPGMKGNLYVMNLDGSDRKQLTNQDAKSMAFSPSWSPDGKRIAYSTMVFEGTGPPKDLAVMVMDADGKNARKLADGMMPTFSPDGKQVLYTALEKGDGKDDFNPRLYVMDADGKNAKRLVETMSMMGAWSPDGKRIVYMGATDGRRGEPDIFIMKADGSEQTHLAKTEKEVELSPRFSADGKWIYFNRASSFGGPLKSIPIYVMDTDGKNEKQITKEESADLIGGGGILIVSMAARALKPVPPGEIKEP